MTIEMIQHGCFEVRLQLIVFLQDSVVAKSGDDFFKYARKYRSGTAIDDRSWRSRGTEEPIDRLRNYKSPSPC